MKTGTIYMLTNTLNGKRYVGQTLDFERRMRGYDSGAVHSILGLAVSKYGWHRFHARILAEVPVMQLDTCERFWIRFLDCLVPKGYNVSIGGTGSPGRRYSLSAGTRARMSAAQKGRSVSLETRAKISAAKLGTPRPQHVKDKISRSHRRKRLTIDWIDLIEEEL